MLLLRFYYKKNQYQPDPGEQVPGGKNYCLGNENGTLRSFRLV
jgi:hypothetical protein